MFSIHYRSPSNPSVQRTLRAVTTKGTEEAPEGKLPPSDKRNHRGKTALTVLRFSFIANALHFTEDKAMISAAKNDSVAGERGADYSRSITSSEQSRALQHKPQLKL